MSSDLETSSFELDPFQTEIIRRFEEVDKDLKALRGELIRRTAPITPLTGEIVFFGTRWRKEHILPVTLLLALTAFVVKQAMARLSEQDVAIKAFTAFVDAGGRATSRDLSVVGRCVALRFKERAHGVAAGEALATPDPTTEGLIAKCRADLDLLLAELESR